MENEQQHRKLLEKLSSKVEEQEEKISFFSHEHQNESSNVQHLHTQVVVGRDKRGGH